MGPVPVLSLEFLLLAVLMPILEAGPMVLWAYEEQNWNGIANTWLTFLRWGDSALPNYHCWYLLLSPILILSILKGVWRYLHCGLFLNAHGYWRVFTTFALLAIWVTSLVVFLLKSRYFCFLLVEFYAFYRHKPFICHTHYCVITNVSISSIQSYAISKSICYICCWYLFPCCAPPIAAFGFRDFLIFNLV